MFSEIEKPPGQWTEQRIVRIGQYFVRTDFEGFWDLLENGEAVIFCQYGIPKFYSKNPGEFIRSRGAAARRFAEKRIGWIDPRLYCFGSQGLSDHQIYELRKAVLDRKTD